MADFRDVKSILSRFDPTEERYISREFQKYGYILAEELGDLEHKSLYIKLAKETPRHLLEEARRYVSDSNARSKPRLFMWKLAQLRRELKNLKTEKQKNEKT